MPDRILKFFTSLRLTVACLGFALVLVFVGTLAQVDEGLYQAQARYFKSWLIWSPNIAGHKLPLVLPGGYLLGAVLLVNLLAAHAKRFKFEKRKIGILMVHAGLILLLLGQLFTDVLSTESAMRLAEGETRNYSEDFHANELAVVDESDPQEDQVVAVPERLVAQKGEIRHEKLPFSLRVKNYWANTDLLKKPADGSVPAGASQGLGTDVHLLPRPTVTSMDERNLPSAIVEVVTPAGGSLGSWLVSSQLHGERFTHENKTYQLALRFQRYYKPYSLTLLNFTHEIYKGTDIPKNFASRVQLRRPDTHEDREVLIYMNNPLRYDGMTFYQASFEKGDKVTILQVVKNPGWLTPYFACLLVGLGLVIQFLTHLIGFAKRRNA